MTAATLLILADDQLRPLVRVLRQVKALARITIRHVHPAELAENGWPDAELAEIAVLWEQEDEAHAAWRDELRRRLPTEARVLRFPALRCSALWPFAAAEGAADDAPWALPGDRVASDLAAAPDCATLSDDALFALYLAESEAAMPDVSALMQHDVEQWLARDALCDVRLADFLAERVLTEKLFHSPARLSGVVLRRLLNDLVTLTFGASPAALAAIEAELTPLLHGHAGDDAACAPVHPLVAEQLGLAWFDPQANWRWHGHEWNFRQWVLHCARRSSFVP